LALRLVPADDFFLIITRRMTPEEIQNRLLVRDGMMLIINKPAGISVHAGPQGGPNLEMYFEALRFGLSRPPVLAHRLDRDTSGCLVLGRHHKALSKLGKLFAAGRVEKTYWAIVAGAPPEARGIIDLPLKKMTNKNGWKIVTAPDGQPAVTEYRTLGAVKEITWLELKPKSGRTHQIRVHCAALGCPVLGDPVYGNDKQPAMPLHLHARAIIVPLYANKPSVTAEAPPPAHMLTALERCGYQTSDGAQKFVTP
jgi:tRNA pseudouridine32 synthase/23S rRNA pseudouridine746 synthase/23S rRNA pseudouridine1911/1915/1917 synthase